MNCKFKKTAAAFLSFFAAIGCVTAAAPVCLANDALGTVETATPSIAARLDGSLDIFSEYLKKYPDADYPDSTVTTDMAETVLSPSQKVELPVTVGKPGFYALKIEYAIPAETSQTPAISVSINGETPYYEAYNVSLQQTYVDEYTDLSDDEKRTVDYIPSQKAVVRYTDDYLYDTSGYYGKILYFYLDTDTKTLELTSLIGKIALKSVKFCPYKAAEEYKNADMKNAPDYKDEAIYFEAENMLYKSSASIYPINDSSSPGVSPTSEFKKYSNSVGGSYWENLGEYVEWSFEVPEDAYYSLTFKYRQSDVVGMSSSRRILIDGAVPYRELETYAFNYTPTYLNETLSADGKPIKIYLTKGKHTLKMQIVLSELSEILSYLNLTINALSDDYRKVIMITGSTVDPLRDYNLEKSIPEVLTSFREKGEYLSEMANRLEKAMGGNSNGTKTIRTIAGQLISCSEDGYYITKNISSIKSNISSVNAWLVDARSQPLKLDYFVLSAPGGKVKSPEPSFIRTVGYHIKSFLFTFSSEYDQNAVAKSSNANEITVWTAGNSTSYSILKQLIEKDFEKKSGIKVNLRLSPGDFNLAVLSGRGPDVSSGEPMTLAFRNRLVNLAEFKDIDEVLSRFRESAILPLGYKGKIYALPTTQNINLTYYRTDIFEDLGLEVPKTWDDVTYVMSTLQKNNLEMGVNGFFNDILYQHGGSYYNEELTACALDSAEAIEAFTQYTSYFTEYSAPLTYNQLNRFRTGEMPIVFAPFNFSTTLLNLATEISGRWAVAEIPCTKKEDGTYDHSTCSASEGWFILNKEKKNACWEFIKWITSTDVIVENTKLNVAAMDETVRTCPANVEAFYKVGWPEEMLKLARIHEDGRLITVPAVPGSYMVTRNYNFAFSNVVYNSAVPADALKSQIKSINFEIERKCREFGLESE